MTNCVLHLGPVTTILENLWAVSSRAGQNTTTLQNHEKKCSRMFIASLFVIAAVGKPLKSPPTGK